MIIPEHAMPDPLLPEQHLLRDSDRLQDYAGAFLRGEITAVQYSELALAEISRRAPLDLMQPLGDPAPDDDQDLVPPVALHEDLPSAPVAPPPVVPARRTDDDRALVLARAFVGGRICGPDYLRLVRDC